MVTHPMIKVFVEGFVELTTNTAVDVSVVTQLSEGASKEVLSTFVLASGVWNLLEHETFWTFLQT